MPIRKKVVRVGLTCFIAGIALLGLGQMNLAGAQSLLASRYVMMVIDKSFSVLKLGSDGPGAQVISQSLTALQVECPDCWVGAMVFGDQITRVVEIQPLDDWDNVDINRILSPGELGLGTNFAEAIRQASAELVSKTNGVAAADRNNVELRIVLLTDTKLDEFSYPAQKQELEGAVKTLKTEGIQLVAIDNVPGGPDENLWGSLTNETGGWYMKGNPIGPDNNIVRTLVWAFGKPPDAIGLQGDEITRTFSIDPYQRRVTLRLTYNGEITPTLRSPTGRASVKMDQRDGQIDLIIENPVAGEWSIRVRGTGTFKLLAPIADPRRLELALSDLRQSQQALPVGTPVYIELILRDTDERTFIVSNPISVSALLIDDKGPGRGSLDVSFDASCSCYKATKQDVIGLEGQYFVEVQALAPWLSRLIILANPPRIVWGRVPEFTEPPRVFLPELPKVNSPFSVTVNLKNLDTVSKVVVQLKSVDLNNLQPSEPILIECQDGQDCRFTVPGLPVNGYYTFTAALREGRTLLGIAYPSSAPSGEISVVLYVRGLNSGEWFLENWWKVAAILAATLAAILFLYYVFGYRILIGLSNDYESLSRLSR